LDKIKAKLSNLQQREQEEKKKEEEQLDQLLESV